MDFNHIGDHLTTGQTVVDSICSLAFTVADIGTVITCSETAFFCDSFADFFYKDIQMSASRMAVTIGAFNHNLDFSKIFFCPACSNAQRIKLRCKLSHFLTF